MRWWVMGLGLAMSLAACSSPPAAQGVAPAATSPPIPTSNPNEPWKLTATAEAVPATRAPVANGAAVAATPRVATGVPAVVLTPTLATAAGGYAITVNSWSDAPPTVAAPAHGGLHYVAFDVTVANRGTRAAPYNPIYFKVKDAADMEYSAALMASSGRQTAALTAGDLPPGEQVRGLLVFEVPTGGKLTQLEYRPIQIGNNARVVTRLTE
jgi:hypothetical protein